MEEEDNDMPQGRPDAAPTGPPMGPIYVMWENALEKLKILNYEWGFCSGSGKANGQKRKPFSRIHFVYPGSNPSHQFNDFIEICAWIMADMGHQSDLVSRYDDMPDDDPNTVCNKLMLSLRQLDFKSSFPTQKLRLAHGEAVCSVLDFLTDKALSAKGFKWGVPVYTDADEVEQAEVDDEGDADIEDDAAGGHEDDAFFAEVANVDAADLSVSLDNSAHHILQAAVDPVAWKTELERVGPKLRAQQQLSANEWRAHVDQTVTNNQQIGKVLGETQNDLSIMNKVVSEELNKMRTKEKYMNNQYAQLCTEYQEVKKILETLETKAGKINEGVAKLTNELAEVSEKLDDMKESLESKDSGIHDTSPLVRMKAALQQIKSEACAFDLRIGVVSHSLLAARVGATQRRRMKVAQKAKQRQNKNKKGKEDTGGDDNSLPSGDEE